MNETLNEKYLRLFCQPLKNWHSGRKFNAKKGNDMHPYYKSRIREAEQTSFIVVGSIVLAVVVSIVIKILSA